MRAAHGLPVKGPSVVKAGSVGRTSERRRLSGECPQSTCSTEGQFCYVHTSPGSGPEYGTCLYHAFSGDSSDTDGTVIADDGSSFPSVDYAGGDASITTMSSSSASTESPPQPEQSAGPTTTEYNPVMFRHRRRLSVCLMCDTSSLSASTQCYDLVDWEDSDGDTCSAYVSCRAGYHTSIADAIFDSYAVDGVSALEACCDCGGGSTSDFMGGTVVTDDPRSSSNLVIFAVVCSCLVFVVLLCTSIGVAVRNHKRRAEQRRVQRNQENEVQRLRELYSSLHNPDLEDLNLDMLDDGIDAETLNRLPVREFGAADDGAHKFGTTCSVCLCDFELGESVRTLPCAHDFHAECIDKWFECARACPVCKTVVGVGRVGRDNRGLEGDEGLDSDDEDRLEASTDSDSSDGIFESRRDIRGNGEVDQEDCDEADTDALIYQVLCALSDASGDNSGNNESHDEHADVFAGPGVDDPAGSAVSMIGGGGCAEEDAPTEVSESRGHQDREDVVGDTIKVGSGGDDQERADCAGDESQNNSNDNGDVCPTEHSASECENSAPAQLVPVDRRSSVVLPGSGGGGAAANTETASTGRGHASTDSVVMSHEEMDM